MERDGRLAGWAFLVQVDSVERRGAVGTGCVEVDRCHGRIFRRACWGGSCGRGSGKGLGDGMDDLAMEFAVGGDYAAVFFEGLSQGEVEGFSVNVRNGSAGLGYDDPACSVVPRYVLRSPCE